MQMYACARIDMLLSRTCQCIFCNCFNVTLLVAKNFCTFTMCRSQVKVTLQIGAWLSTYLCTHYMYVHMALCHDCTYIWVDVCLYKLFLYNLSCLHRLVHVSLSVHSSICYSISKDKITIGKFKKITLKFNWTPTSRRDQRWALSLFGNAAGTLFFWKPCRDGNHLQNLNERGPKLQPEKQLEETLAH